VPNANGALRPGLFATAEVQTIAQAEPLLAVPADAVMQVEDESIVFVPGDGPGKYKRVDVKVGPSAGGWTPILAGLREGDNVVTRGAVILKAQLSKPAEE
jgi:cobalt-zinc-cadmium efflux system membrane fusion protein